MSGRTDYTNREWAQLKRAAEIVGMGMLEVSGSGPIGKLRELVVLASCLIPGAAPAQFSQNKLVVAVLEDGREEPLGPANYLLHRDLTGLIIAMLIGRQRVLTHCERIAALLAAKSSPAEAEGLKQWLLWIAGRVAEAGGISWLGVRRKVSDEEIRMLNEIASALSICTVATIPASSELSRMPGLAPPDAESAPGAFDV